MTSKRKLPAALACIGAILSSAPAEAQNDCHGVYSQMCAYSSSSGSSSGVSIQDIIRGFSERSHNEAVDLNNQANERVRAGDEAGALALYRQAQDRYGGVHRNPAMASARPRRYASRSGP